MAEKYFQPGRWTGVWDLQGEVTEGLGRAAKGNLALHLQEETRKVIGRKRWKSQQHWTRLKNVLVHQVAGLGPPESGSLLFLRYSTISCQLNYGLFDMDPWLPVCGPDLSHELLTCVCNRRPENSKVSPKKHRLTLSETHLRNFLSKPVFSSQDRPLSPRSLMPRM